MQGVDAQSPGTEPMQELMLGPMHGAKAGADARANARSRCTGWMHGADAQEPVNGAYAQGQHTGPMHRDDARR